MKNKRWNVYVGDRYIGEVVGEDNESDARCAALYRYGVVEEEIDEISADDLSKYILPDDEFSVTPV